MIKILHTGDIHLDSPFSGSGKNDSEIRRMELRGTFTSMMTYARLNGVDLVLIAGDAFDSQFVTRETLEIMKREFSALKCPVVISPGNHDPASEDSIWVKGTFPENVHIFKSGEFSKFSFPELNADVYGYAFTSSEKEDCPLAGQRIVDSGRINVICAHGDMRSAISPYAPISREVLAGFGADFAALGHIHNAQGLEGQAGKCTYIYCGCPEGRGFDECGPKGAVVAEIEKEGAEAKISLRRVRFSKRQYEVASLSVNGALTEAEIAEKIKEYAFKNHLGNDVILRVVLTGAVSPSLVISEKLLRSALPELFSLSVTDNTLPIWDGELLCRDMSIKGEFYRMLSPKLESSDEKERSCAAKALRYAMAALAGENMSDISGGEDML